MKPKPPLRYCSSGKPDCGHCKKQVPQVKTGLLDKFKPYGFKVFAVHTQNDKENGKILLPNMNYSISSTVGILRIKLISGYTITSILLRSCISWIRKKKSFAKKLDIEQFADILTKEYKRIGVEVKNV